MGEQMTFKRYEIKYLLTTSQYNQLQELMKEHMVPDKHGNSVNCSLYFDTPDFILARRSAEHPLYKEKLRVRTYGIPKPDTQVFVELKKKYESVIYKRRINLTPSQMENYLINHYQVMDTQISREIDYFMSMYDGIKPQVYLSYERCAFYGKDNHDFRITFDQNILFRDYDLSLTDGFYGEPILPEDTVLMEVKTAAAIPLWLVKFMSANNINKTSFSKYGNAYKRIINRRKAKVYKFQNNNNLIGGIYNYA